METYKSDIVDINLESGSIHRSFLNHAIGFKDDDADRFGVRVFRDGEPVDLGGVSCQAIFMAPDGTNIALTSYGTISGNKAYVTLPQACYDVEGQFCLAIKLVGGGITSTVRIIDGVVVNTGATGTVAPTGSVPDYQEILALYDEMEAAADLIENLGNRTTEIAKEAANIAEGAEAYPSYTGLALVDFSSVNGESSSVIGYPDGVDFELHPSVWLDNDKYYALMMSIGGSAVTNYIQGIACQALDENGDPITVERDDGETGETFAPNTHKFKGFGKCRTIKIINYQVVSGTISNLMFYDATGGLLTVSSAYSAFSYNGNTKSGKAFRNAITEITKNEAFSYLAGHGIIDTGISISGTGTYKKTDFSTDKDLHLDGGKKYLLIAHLVKSSYSGNSNFDANLGIETIDGRVFNFTKIFPSERMSYLITETLLYGTIDLTGEEGVVRCVPYLILSNMGSSASFSYSIDNYAVFKYDNNAAELAKLFQSNRYNFSESVNKDTNILYWGDSLTAGSGASDYYHRWTYICSHALGATFINGGVGGETATTIAVRQGGDNMIIPAGNINGTYEPDDFKDVFGELFKPLAQGIGYVNPIRINGYEAELSAEVESYVVQSYEISGYAGPSSDIPLLASCKGAEFTADVTCIWVGHNGPSSLDKRIAIIDSMLAKCDEHYLVIGLVSGNDESRTEEDQRLLYKYGSKFVPMRRMLVDYGMTINNLTPTQEDIEEIAAGRVPGSLRTDGIHLNDYGYNAVGILMAQKMRSLGYDKLFT